MLGDSNGEKKRTALKKILIEIYFQLNSSQRIGARNVGIICKFAQLLKEETSLLNSLYVYWNFDYVRV